MAALPKFISLPDAAKKIHTSVDDLRPLIEKGKIKAVTINGEIFVDTLTLPKQIVKKKEEMPEYKKFKHLKGHPIRLSQAAIDYKINDATLGKWIRKGYIKKIDMDGKRSLFDEQDVAYCAYIYHRDKKLRGQWLFNDNGTPHIAGTRKRATVVV